MITSITPLQGAAVSLPCHAEPGVPCTDIISGCKSRTSCPITTARPEAERSSSGREKGAGPTEPGFPSLTDQGRFYLSILNLSFKSVLLESPRGVFGGHSTVGNQYRPLTCPGQHYRGELELRKQPKTRFKKNKYLKVHLNWT
ncbi:GTP cyclohydrolase 1 [Platysternon megacephalum]|uniref:GTP cyclohydrolase 1 n=1 Tax=Platysternon megacephalum TaxID=55544 RepID=A0A4D9ECW1_9SAUR|nr:GTP cyclohydrolase 1 [Platysternon megacephalum]